MARMGMDADAVESAGRALKERAGQIDAIVSGLDRSVKGLLNVWEGPDAQTFVNKWWPEHRALLVTARGHVDGLGQSALNNASEQRGASNVKGDHGATSLNPGGGGDTAPAKTTPPSSSAANGPAFSSWAAGAIGRGIDVDHASGNQCVDVINDYAEARFPGVDHGVSIGGGNAKDLFSGASTQYFDKLPPGSTPQPGDIICIGPNDYSPTNGHVAVVESVQNGVVHVVQQDGNNPGGVTYRGQISTTEMNALQGYLRPKS